MNPLLAGVFGAGAGVGLWAVLRLLVPAKPDLARSLAQITAAPQPPDGNTETAEPDRLTAWTVRLGLPRAAIRADLAALDRATGDYLRNLMRIVAIAAAAPIALALGLAASGTSLNLLVVAAASIGLALIAVVAVEAEIHAKAEQARTEARRALAVVLSLCAMALSGGAGIESALRSAAASGHGPAFARIQSALDRAVLLGTTPWQALADLGDRLSVDAYTQLASTTALAGTEGARIRSSLTDRATALRAARLADIETEALAATERMSLPIVAMATAFVIIVGFPALERIMTGL
ncbi:type II secretion system F family protein [Glycomyces sp. L485]|uniref:type II secretion system F family protein n=1 Tax=Glycomyces sp. L485 TaxID=2909235 RepID=UPI001F4B01B6|nr:type II secretion system F family protein [Glycomyces sp. L485]MCH7229958.1 type II secretion system F family protein [Glycomyces sp. L485]